VEVGNVTEREKTGIELLLSEAEIVAWLEPDENKDDDETVTGLGRYAVPS
jgi:hypothetical protein